MQTKPKVAMVPFGYPGYPRELQDRFRRESEAFLKKMDLDLFVTPTVIEPADAEKAAQSLRGREYDFLVVLILTWIEAPNVIEVIKEFSQKPILLWSHTMWKEGAEWRTLGPIPGVGVIRQTFEEMGWNFKFVYGMPGEEKLKAEIPPFARAASALSRLRRSRIGLLGYMSMGMYTAGFDHLALRRDLGPEVDQLDQYVLIKRLEAVKPSEVRPLIAKAKRDWDLGKAVREKDLEITLRMYVALKGLIKVHRWSALNVKCQYELSKEYGYVPCVPLSLLGNEIPCSCEGDVPLAATQLILHYLTGGITSYCDIHTIEPDRLLMGACGFAPFGLGMGKAKVGRTTTLYEGLANCTIYKEGQITMARLAYSKDRKLRMHVALGQAGQPRPFREIGCLTYPGMEVILDGSGDEFGQRLMSQHYAIIYGDARKELKEFLKLASVEGIFLS